MQETGPASPPSAEVVGNAFVEQYYHILHHEPELVHRFYQDASLLSRLDNNGVMTTVTSMQAINDKILSWNYEHYTADIKTADAQQSYKKGVIVLVTGCLTGKDNVKKDFTQMFFLAPQDKGYFVLNDVFRFVGEHELLPDSSVLLNGVNKNALPSALTPEPESTQAIYNHTVEPTDSFEEEDLENGAEVVDPSDKEEGSVFEEEVVEPPIDSIQNEVLITSMDAAPAASEDAPKKSYASIVKVTKGNTGSRLVYVPITNMRATCTNAEQQTGNSIKPTTVSEAMAPASGTPETNVPEEAEGHSIYVRKLPFDTTVSQLDEAFKRFGPIKCDGVQVRSNKQGFCFGFVEFETLSSMESALEASPIKIGGLDAIIEEKRTNTRVRSTGRGRYASGRSGFRGDSFKSQCGFGGGRGGYGRNEFRNQGEFSGRANGSTGRDGYDNQWVNPNGSRRGGRQGLVGAKGSSVPT